MTMFASFFVKEDLEIKVTSLIPNAITIDTTDDRITIYLPDKNAPRMLAQIIEGLYKILDEMNNPVNSAEIHNEG